MKKTYKILLIIFLILLFVTLTILSIKYKKTKISKVNEDLNEIYSDMKNNSIMYNDDATLQELKEEYKIEGNNELYEIETEYDGRKAVVIKPEINYNVAFSGLIKKEKPEFSEINDIIKNNYPNDNGIWIESESREKILEYLNNNESFNTKYYINENGYLQLEQNNNKTENDLKIEKIVNSQKQYIFAICGFNYMVDNVTGDIIKNPYEDLSADQPYDYFEYDNKMLIFITENSNKKLTNDEIFNSILNLIIG